MTWTFCTSGAAIAMAGANANSTIVASGATLLQWATETEGSIVKEARFDFLNSYSSLSTDTKNALAEATAAMIAMKIIMYDMAGYTSRYEAATMLDFCRDTALRNMANLRDSKQTSVRSV